MASDQSAHWLDSLLALFGLRARSCRKMSHYFVPVLPAFLLLASEAQGKMGKRRSTALAGQKEIQLLLQPLKGSAMVCNRHHQEKAAYGNVTNRGLCPYSSAIEMDLI